MRDFINILTETFDEFSMKGHADQKVKQNAPRFSDNPMQDDPIALDEFDADTMHNMAKTDRLHDMLNDAGVSDHELSLGVELSGAGLHKVAAALGIGPDEVKTLIASLTQRLRDDDQEDSDIEESYRLFMEAGTPNTPFEPEADNDRLSAEADYLGDLTVRSSKSGREKFYQGSQAADITDALKGADDAQKQNVLRPLMELDEETGFADEIKSDSGSYNFPWKLDDQNGFGTVQYGLVGNKPIMKLISIRDAIGNTIDADQHMRSALMAQAKGFIADA